MQWERLKKRIRRSQREKTPVILQMDNTECGAVALAIILGYFGCYVPPSEVRDACDVTRDGSKAINLIKAARRYGLEAHGMQLTLDGVKDLPPPFIAYWQFNHFLVVEGFAENVVYLNDPATGPRTVTMEEFAQSFTGIALFMNPGPDFQQSGKPEPSLLQLLWQRLSGSRWSFFWIICTVLAETVPLISLAFFAKIFLDDILLNGQRDWLPGLLLCMLISALLLGVLTGLKQYYLVRLYLKLKLTGAARFFWRILHLPLKFFQQRATGDIAERVEAHSDLADILADKVTAHIAGLLTMVFVAVVMFLLSGPLALLNLTVTLINFFCLWMMSRRNADLGRRFTQAEGKLSGMEMNGIQMIETLKASAVEAPFFNHWAAVHAQKMESEQRMECREAFLKVLSKLLQGLNIAALWVMGCWLILHNQLTPGGLVALQILLISFTQPLRELLRVSEHLYQLKGDVSRILDVDQQAPEQILSGAPTALPLPAAAGPLILECRHLEFGYSKLEPPVFSDISFQVRAGERVAIVGPTGGGKSSMAKLICGLYAPWSGEILMQGTPLANISRTQLAAFAGVVDQHIFLFAATVRDNLTLWNPEISDADIYRALKIVQMTEIIKERGGLDCRVEERGKNFSGGQVQRLEIARALIGNPQLLILDEATAALDPLLEQQIYANLQQHHCALVIIAHRLSAIRDCDQIIVINGGKIVQQGRHESLIQDSGLYKELVSLEIQ